MKIRIHIRRCRAARILLQGAVLSLLFAAENGGGHATAAAPITGVTITSDGLHVLSVSQFGLQVSRFSDLQVIQQLATVCLQLHDVKLNRDNTRIAIAGGNPAEHGVVAVFSWPELQPVWQQQFSEDVFYCVSFQQANSLLAVAGHDGSVSLCDAETGTAMATLAGHSKPVTSVAFVPETQLLLSGGLDQTIRLWQTDTRQVVRSLNNHTNRIRHLAVFAGDADQQSLLVSGGDDRTVRFWQPAIGRMLRFQRLSSAVTALDWTPSGQQAVAATADGQVVTVERDSLQTQVVHQTPGDSVVCLSVHPDGDKAVIGTREGRLIRVSLSQSADAQDNMSEQRR